MGLRSDTGTAATSRRVATLVAALTYLPTSSAVAHPASFTLSPPFSSRTFSRFDTNAHTMTCPVAPGGVWSEVTGTTMCLVVRSPSTAETMTDTAVGPLAVSMMYGALLLALTASLPLLQSFSSMADPITANLLLDSDTAPFGGSTVFAASTSDIGIRMLLMSPP